MTTRGLRSLSVIVPLHHGGAGGRGDRHADGVAKSRSFEVYLDLDAIMRNAFGEQPYFNFFRSPR
jgi:hypothetical protein